MTEEPWQRHCVFQHTHTNTQRFVLVNKLIQQQQSQLLPTDCVNVMFDVA